MTRFFRSTGRDIVETAILALLLFLAVRSSVQNFKVEGLSMYPSLSDGEYILVDKVSYGTFGLGPLERILPVNSNDDGFLFRGPQRGDVIVFVAPGTEDRDFIKRVMAIPGDTVEIRNGVVIVNGEPIQEPFIERPGSYSWPPNGGGPVTVPSRQYFVLGDNRNNSSDSHIWGFVPADRIIGKALVSYWPFSNLGPAPNHQLP